MSTQTGIFASYRSRPCFRKKFV